MLRAVILISILVLAVKGDGCVQRSFGKNFIVCVCNSTYCDIISEPDIQENEAIWYTSTQNGKRMDSSSINMTTDESFAKNESKNQLTLIVNSNQRYQEIYGFGGAMTDAAALNIKKLSNETQERLLESYFGSIGIGYTYVRIPIAGTDFSTRPYTYDDEPGDITLRKFNLVEEDDFKIEYLHKIKDLMFNSSSLRIFTTSWSAPAWMKTSNKITWGFLKRKYYLIYANYIKKFFDAYNERGIDIWGITPGNEPIDGFVPTFTFNAMGWTPEESATWSTDYLAPTLSEAGYNPVYMAMDDQRFLSPGYTAMMFKNPRARIQFKGTAVHWYADPMMSPLRLDKLHNMYPDKFILMTEACMGSYIWDKQKVILGSWERGEFYILDIIQNLSHWVVGWIDWNMALDEHGKPNWAKNYVDSPIIVIPQTDEFYKQPMFYAISHFSKFVPRGSHRIFSTGLENQNLVKAIAFLTPEMQKCVVMVNKGYFPVPITIKDNSGKMMNLNLPAKSFNTLLW